MNRENLQIPGYKHPDKINFSSGKVYKMFTEGKKPVKNEKFKNTSIDNNYSSYDKAYQTPEKHN